MKNGQDKKKRENIANTQKAKNRVNSNTCTRAVHKLYIVN